MRQLFEYCLQILYLSLIVQGSIILVRAKCIVFAISPEVLSILAKKMMLLINPNAGKGQYKASLAGVLNVLSNSGIIPSVFYTLRSGHAVELIRDHASEYDMVGCIGGDGTLSEVVAGIMKLGSDIPIGYIPMGTANDVAKTLGLDSKQPLASAKRIADGSPMDYDVGVFGPDNYFTYIAAFGAFTEVSYATPQEAKHTLGHMAYMLEAIKSLPKLSGKKAIIEYDDGVIRDEFIFGAITNSTSVAGLLKLDSSKVSLSDGMFEVLLIRMPQAIKDLNEIITSILSNNFDQNNVVFLKSREVRIMFEEPVAWTRDGEDGGLHQDICIFNHHNGVKIIV